MGEAGDRWSEGLAALAIPDEILRAAPQSPYGFDPQLFARATVDAQQLRKPSHRAAMELLQQGGSVIDVGCGAGAASLPLAPSASKLIGVDESHAMLEAFAERAEHCGVEHVEVQGRWPDVASDVPTADVVVCHHVFYNVPDLDAFAAALTDHARSGVVVELTQEHPLAWTNPYWESLHGIVRPHPPTFEDVVEVLRELGLAPAVQRWNRPSHLRGAEHDMLSSLRRRLCVGPERDEELRPLLEAHPPPPVRHLVTLRWTT